MPNTGLESGDGLLHVAAGCLERADGSVLICQRPPRKIYPGEWEFPGGKMEAGESAEQALRRELKEELSIDVTRCEPLIRTRHHYPELSVELHVWRVTGWTGEVRSSEHPQIAWVPPSQLKQHTLLAANRPIVSALCLPAHYVFTPPKAAIGEIRTGLASLPESALLRLRLPALGDSDYARAARELKPDCDARGLVLVLDGDPRLSRELDCGWHATAAALAGLRGRPVPAGRWFAASCHGPGELAAARELGADLVVLGPVRDTGTHPGAAVLGWDGFEAIAVEAGAPVYAIGGVGPEQLQTAVLRGARGVAGISAYWSRVPAGGDGVSSSSGMV